MKKRTKKTALNAGPRTAAFRTLRDWDKPEQRLQTLLRGNSVGLADRDAAFAAHLLQSVARNLRGIDHLIGGLCARPPDRIAREILRLGLAQVLFTREPAHAIANETVALAPDSMRAFVNAVIRRSIRERQNLRDRLAHAEPYIRFNLPAGLWQRWRDRFGDEKAKALAEFCQLPPETTFSINSFHPKAEEVARNSGLRAIAKYPHFFTMESAIPPYWFEEGLVYAQDPATAMACRLLNPRPGERILDACAAPGGKTRLLAELSGGQAEIVANDPAPKRLLRLKTNIRNLQLPGVTVRAVDWLAPVLNAESLRRGGFDAAIVDAPCSNTGVIRRRIEVARFFRESSLADHARTQLAILRSVARTVRPGGRLVYSTCSLEPEENEFVVRDFLAQQPDWTLQTSESTFPPQDQCDGHSAALLIRDPGK